MIITISLLPKFYRTRIMTKECYVFKKNGKCKFGDSCRYKHIKRDKSPSKTQLKSKEICPYFISKEGILKHYFIVIFILG